MSDIKARYVGPSPDGVQARTRVANPAASTARASEPPICPSPSRLTSTTGVCQLGQRRWYPAAQGRLLARVAFGRVM